jgi:hypothetical protein
MWMLGLEEVLPTFTYEGDALIQIRLVVDGGDATMCADAQSNQAILRGIKMSNYVLR